MKKILPFLLVLLASAVAHSDDTLTPTMLRSECEGSASGKSFCIGVLIGTETTLHSSVDGILCTAVTGERLRLTYLNETAKHPQLLDADLTVSLAGAFVSGGVCRLVKAATRPAVSPIS
jgi:hypothetical protein